MASLKRGRDEDDGDIVDVDEVGGVGHHDDTHAHMLHHHGHHIPEETIVMPSDVSAGVDHHHEHVMSVGSIEPSPVGLINSPVPEFATGAPTAVRVCGALLSQPPSTSLCIYSLVT